MIIQIQPWIDNSELEELKKVIESTYITENKMTKLFENMTKKLTSSKYAISVANGTVGLYCALKSMDIGIGDEVIVPNLTFIASSNAVILAGAKPVFCDIKKETLTIDESKIPALINKNTKAIMPVHLYGFTAEMNELKKIASKHNLKIIEDAAQGVAVKYKGKHVGPIGDIGVLSYYGNKTITTGEGGMILTNNEEFAKRCYRLKNHGRDKKGTFIHNHIGFNFSFTDLQAAIGVSQMKKLDKIINKKQVIFNKYFDSLKMIDELKFYKIKDQEKPVYWFSSFYSKKVDGIIDFLKSKGIQTRRFFYPLHLQPCYQKELLNINPDHFKVSEDVYFNSLSLPSSYVLKEKEQDFIIKNIKSFFKC